MMSLTRLSLTSSTPSHHDELDKTLTNIVYPYPLLSQFISSIITCFRAK